MSVALIVTISGLTGVGLYLVTALATMIVPTAALVVLMAPIVLFLVSVLSRAAAILAGAEGLRGRKEAEAYRLYRRALAANNALDFDDLVATANAEA